MPRREDRRESDDKRQTTRLPIDEPISVTGVQDDLLQQQQFLALLGGGGTGTNGAGRSLDQELSQRLAEVNQQFSYGCQCGGSCDACKSNPLAGLDPNLTFGASAHHDHHDHDDHGHGHSSSTVYKHSHSDHDHSHNSSGGGPNNFKPFVEALESEVILGKSITVASMFKYFDLDNNPLRRIRITDMGNTPSSGYFIYRGKRLDATQSHEYAAADLKYLRYKSGAEITQEVFAVQAYDGKFWSDQDTAVVSTKRDVNEKPIGQFLNQSSVSGERYRMDEMFQATDADNDAIRKYRFRYQMVAGGYLEFKGQKLNAGEWIELAAKDFKRVFFQTKNWGSGVRKIKFSGRAYDGRDWSKTVVKTYNIAPNNARPEVVGNDIEVAVGQKIKASNLFRASDPNGNSIKRVWFYDTGVRVEGGHFEIDGVRQQARQWFSVKFSDLNKVDYIGATLADKERLRIRVSDGRFRSKVTSVLADTTAVPVIRLRDTVVLDELEEVRLSSLFNQVDNGPAVRLYRVYDSNDDNRSARMYDANGNRLEQGVVHELTPDEFRSLTIKGGKSDGRAYDSIMVRANNGQKWSDWARTNISTETNHIAALRAGPTWNSQDGEAAELTYSFMLWVPEYYPLDAQERTNFIAYNGEQRVGARKSLQAWADVSGLSFREQKQHAGGNLGHIAHGTADLGDDSIAAWAYYPRSLVPSLPGDVWLNNTVASNLDQSEGGWGFLTHIHEHGHAWGLKHSFDAPYVLPSATENHQFTVMSYSVHPNTFPVNPSTPMLYDIAAIQEIYGTNWNYNKHATNYRWERNEQFVATIWDGGGIDTFDFSNQVSRQVIDLRQGQFSSVAGLENNLGIAFKAVIENARGGQHDDQITGNESKNIINGHAGNDTMMGMGGPDILRGGEGNDTYVYHIGDGRDRIDETGSGGRDNIEIHVDRNIYANFGDGSDPNKKDDALKDHMRFRRAGNDLQISLTMNENEGRGGIKILNQAQGGSQVETLKLYADGELVKNEIDLTAIYTQATNRWQAFELTNFKTEFGYIATPV